MSKETRTKIKSTKNTQKITSAMQKVAASKMAKTQKKMKSTRSYSAHIARIMKNIRELNIASRYDISMLRIPAVIKNITLVVIGTDKGLCGGLNSNIFRVLVETIESNKSANIELCTIGKKTFLNAKRTNKTIVANINSIGESPNSTTALSITNLLTNSFKTCKTDAVYIIYTKFINNITHQATCEQILPLVPSQETKPWNYLCEPANETVINELIERNVSAQLYQCVLESIASEQAARVIAMKSATDNAESLVKQLQLKYNQARQAAITQELAEIVAGSCVSL